MENPICDTVFDSRELIEYFEEIEQETIDNYNEYLEEEHNQQCADEEIEETEPIDCIDKVVFVEKFVEQFEEEISEYKGLKDFIESLGLCTSEFIHGETIIHGSYWRDYCEELLIDCGYIPKDFPSWIEIDWEATSENMAQDYAIVTYEEAYYYIRSN